MKLECINGCKDTWFGYMAKADVEIEVTEESDVLERTIYDYNQSKSAICRKCGKDATQVFEKCKDCGCWKESLKNGLCSFCIDKRLE